MSMPFKQEIHKAVAHGVRQYAAQYGRVPDAGALVNQVAGAVHGMLQGKALELADAATKAKLEQLQADLTRAQQKANRMVRAHKVLAVEAGKAPPEIL